MTKWDFALECKMVQQMKIIQCNYITLTERRKKMIISIDAEKTFEKIQHPFIKKTNYEYKETKST